MIVTWCEVCREFRDGEGGCPECGASRRGYEAVLTGTPDMSHKEMMRGGRIAHNHTRR